MIRRILIVLQVAPFCSPTSQKLRVLNLKQLDTGHGERPRVGTARLQYHMKRKVSEVTNIYPGISCWDTNVTKSTWYFSILTPRLPNVSGNRIPGVFLLR